MKKSKKQRLNNKVSKPFDRTNDQLNDIFKSRIGGAINIRGLSFQLLYACKKILFDLNETNTERKIRLEGIEDVDIINIDQLDFIQLKTSVNTIDASKFWDLGVLQNFLKVYLLEPTSHFTLVHNTSFSKGHLGNLANGKLDQTDIDYWEEKLYTLADINVIEFLKKITFQKESESELITSCFKQLVEKFNFDIGNYERYFQALYHNVFFWSRDRQTITWDDLQRTFQEVTDSFSKAPSNPAIEFNWIKRIAFEISSNDDETYYDGKAAKPIHVVQDLPITRPIWEGKIQDSVDKFDITVIKSSSGQGKSTLAWRIANHFFKSNYAIYQLDYCKDQEQLARLLDFLITRLKIGENPILIIDGLNNTLSGWGILAERIKNLPIKTIVTTREEDWYRYSCDMSKVHLNIIEPYLTKEEAKDIYIQLKSKGKIHKSLNEWEPSWEKIETKGLLIEYIFLLTSGQMLSERIQDQIKVLNKELGSSAKIEILRLISLADTLNIKVQSRKLTNFVQSTIGFQTDRGETYKQLKQEYYLEFDSMYVEGLHPVRSKHIVNVLHDTVPIEESLISLFKIIDLDSIYEYFISVPVLLSDNSRSYLYDELAKMISDYTFSEIAAAFDGLMHSEPLNYWTLNKEIFDEVYKLGGLEVFIQDTIPFSNEKIIRNLMKSMGNLPSNLPALAEKIEQLSPFDFTDSDIVLFAKTLLNYLKNKTFDSHQGLGFVSKWYKQLNIPFSIDIPLNENQFSQIISLGNFSEISELCHYFYIQDKPKYLEIASIHRDKLISVLKKETNSLSIEEAGKNINVNYLLTQAVDKTSSLSFSRIQTIFEILPIYEKYCSKVLVLPFPDEATFDFIVQDSVKEMSPNTIKTSDKFQVHLNQIWYKTIYDNYRSPSIFDWQNQAIQLREESLEFVKRTVKYFESVIERNQAKIASSIKPVTDQRFVIGKLLIIKKNLPSKSKKHISESLFPEQEKLFNSWCFSLNNVINQFLNIFQPETENSRHVALVNLRETVSNLSEMQDAFDSIANSTNQYFNTDDLKKDELIWYARLIRSTIYYVDEFITGKSQKTTHAKTLLEKWWEDQQFEKLEKVHSIVRQFESHSKYVFHLPNKIEEKGKLKYATIGIEWRDIENDIDDFTEVLVGISKLAMTEVDFFTLVYIKASEAIYGLRIHRDFFQRIKNTLETDQDFEEKGLGNPTQITLKDTHLQSLDNIRRKNVKIGIDTESYLNMISDIWQLLEYRNRLNKESTIEMEWLTVLEADYTSKIEKHLEIIRSVSSWDAYNEVEKWTRKVVSKELYPSSTELVELLHKKVKSVKHTLFE